MLTAQMRYCVNCYRPVAGARRARAHVDTAREVETTRRADPTVVFLPDAHEARLRRASRRKRLVITSAVAVVLTIAALVTWMTLTHQSPEQRRALARDEMARRELNLMADGLERFHSDVGRYPTDIEGIRVLIVRPAAFKPSDDQRVSQWLGPYLDSLPEVDPWGNDYVYEAAEGGRGFTLYSHGPGGETGSGSLLQVTSPDSSRD